MYIFKNVYSFRHLQLKIALAILAANDEKYNLDKGKG